MRLDVLAHQGNLDPVDVLPGVDRLLPHLPQLRAFLDEGWGDGQLVQLQARLELLEQALGHEQVRDLVDGLHIPHGNNLLDIDVAAAGDLGNCSLMGRSLTTTRNLLWLVVIPKVMQFQVRTKSGKRPLEHWLANWFKQEVSCWVSLQTPEPSNSQHNHGVKTHAWRAPRIECCVGLVFSSPWMTGT